jgi:hypothetical protein
MVAMKLLGFFRRHSMHGPGTSAFENFRNISAGDRPPSGSGSCQRGRGRGMHSPPRSSRPCSGLPGISWRLQMQNLAHFAVLTWPAPPPSRSNNTIS